MKYESSFKSEADGLEISIMAVLPDCEALQGSYPAGSRHERA
ncbi:MAG: hypothetical protein ACLUTA_15070 [Blautia wexlerae]